MYRGARWAQASKEQRMLALSGVPSRYWRPMKATEADFKGYRVESRKDQRELSITAARQFALYSALTEDDATLQDQRIVMTSPEDDVKALHMGIDILRNRLLSQSSDAPQIIDAREIVTPDHRDSDGSPTGRLWWKANAAASALLIHNITDNTQPARLQVIRDLIALNDEQAVIIIGCGVNPLELAFDRLRVRPDIMFLLNGDISRRQSR